jgi:uncharacterized protein (DUF779 family)
VTIERVKVTEAAAELIRKLRAAHGPLLFHQSGGCCDGSSPMCFPAGEFRIGQNDVRLGEVEGAPVYIGGQQFELWKHTQLVIDAVPGRGSRTKKSPSSHWQIPKLAALKRLRSQHCRVPARLVWPA